MIYLDPALVAGEGGDEILGLVEIVRPVARDPLLAGHFARLFACLTASHSDCLAREENLICSLVYILRQHGMGRPTSSGPSPGVAKALQRVDSAPDTPVSLAELAALSGVSRFQLLRGFHFARLFACLTASHSDCLAREENLICSLVYILRQHGMGGPRPVARRPAWQKRSSAWTLRRTRAES